MNCYIVRGSMKRGMNFYNIYKPDGKKFVGFHDVAKCISIARELNKLYNNDQPSVDQLDSMVWNYSNRKPESVT